MKKLMIVSAALMSVAMLYGAVDYFVSDNKGTLTGLYDEKTKQRNQDSEKIVSVASATSAALTKNEKIQTAVRAAPAKKVKNSKSAKRSISMDQFSRAPLREEVEQISLTSVDSMIQIIENQKIINKDSVMIVKQ